MEITTTTSDQSTRRAAAINTLAIVGFIALILIGIALAIWSARYVPIALNRLATGAVYLSSEFEQAPEVELDVIYPGEEIPFEPVATTTPTYTAPPTTPSAGAPVTPTFGAPRTYSVPVTVPAPAPYGLADLTVEITAVGYCRTNDTDSFRRDREVPDGENGGVQFVVRNTGTNTSDRWDFTYELPTTPALERTVSNQRALGPGDRLEYTVCFTEPRSGDNREISIEVDSDNDVRESNERNNSDSERIDIES